MKKLLLSALIIGLVATSCKKDDDADENNVTCQTCQVDLVGAVEYCDNGDGTYSATTDGQTITQDLPADTTFAEIIAILELSGVSCD